MVTWGVVRQCSEGVVDVACVILSVEGVCGSLVVSV